MSAFQIVPLPPSLAQSVREARSDGHGNTALGLTAADAKPGYPCRVCLEDAEVGESVLLFSHSPFAGPRPYRSVGPVFIHARGCAPYSRPSELPRQLRQRPLSLRAFDAEDRMVDAELVAGEEAEAAIGRLFSHGRTRYIHAHFARPGCFAALVERG